MRRDDDRVLLYDIERAAGRILDYTTGGRDEFLSGPMVQDAVIRNLEIIGEASGKLSEEAKAKLHGVPWPRVIGLRNVLIHGYRDVDMEIVWRVVEEELEPLLEAVRRP